MDIVGKTILPGKPGLRTWSSHHCDSKMALRARKATTQKVQFAGPKSFGSPHFFHAEPMHLNPRPGWRSDEQVGDSTLHPQALLFQSGPSKQNIGHHFLLMSFARGNFCLQLLSETKPFREKSGEPTDDSRSMNTPFKAHL